MTTFGDFIKKEREKLGWTQTDFGAKIGINSSAISRIEKGSKQLSPQKLSALCDLFEKDITELKQLYYAEKFAKEAYQNNCPDDVFAVAEKALKNLRIVNAKQSKLSFGNSG